MAIHARMEAAEKALPGYAAFTARRTALRNDIDRAEREVAKTRAQIVRGLSRLRGARPTRSRLAVAAVQALLRADEALVAILVGSAKSFVWAVTRERAEWAQIDAGAQAWPSTSRRCARASIPWRSRMRRAAPAARPASCSGFDLDPRARAL